MDADPGTMSLVTPGGDRTAERRRRLAEWERRMNPVIVVAAILPIVVALTDRGDTSLSVALDLSSWVVFIVDYVVHLRLRPGYARSKGGIFDLVIVVLTAPWYLIPSLDDARILQLARLGRLGRIFLMSTKGSVLRQLGERLGLAAIYSLTLIVCCGLVVRYVEPAETGLDTFGDALWWATVTFTTVGYGDLVPVTTAGRTSAVFLMLGGIALIGALAGSLGAFFNRGEDAAVREEAAAADGSEQVLDEVRALRAEVAALRDELGSG